MDVDTLRGLVERVRLVPDRLRVFDRDASAARRIYRIAEQVQSDLLDLGFPHRSSAGRRYFDELDLANVSLALRLPSPRYLAMRRWPEILRSAVANRPVRYEVEVSAECGGTPPPHQCEFRLAPEVLALGVQARTARSFSLRRDVGSAGAGRTAPEDLRRLFAEVSGFQFHLLPVALHSDLAFLAATSLADCELSTRYLVERATEEGWDARPSFGLLLSSPYSLNHFWPEIRLDDVWTVFDPHLINSLVRWEVLAPGEISNAQALNAAVFRVAERWIDLAEDAGRPARVSLLTRRRSLEGDTVTSTGGAGS